MKYQNENFLNYLSSWPTISVMWFILLHVQRRKPHVLFEYQFLELRIRSKVFYFFQFLLWLCGSLSLVIYRVLMELCLPVSLVLGEALWDPGTWFSKWGQCESGWWWLLSHLLQFFTPLLSSLLNPSKGLRSQRGKTVSLHTPVFFSGSKGRRRACFPLPLTRTICF